MRRVLKKLQVALPHKAGFSPYTNEEFFKICEDFEVAHDPMSYQNEKFFGTDQHGDWSDYINLDHHLR